MDPEIPKFRSLCLHAYKALLHGFKCLFALQALVQWVPCSPGLSTPGFSDKPPTCLGAVPELGCSVEDSGNISDYSISPTKSSQALVGDVELESSPEPQVQLSPFWITPTITAMGDGHQSAESPPMPAKSTDKGKSSRVFPSALSPQVSEVPLVQPRI